MIGKTNAVAGNQNVVGGSLDLKASGTGMRYGTITHEMLGFIPSMLAYRPTANTGTSLVVLDTKGKTAWFSTLSQIDVIYSDGTAKTYTTNSWPSTGNAVTGIQYATYGGTQYAYVSTARKAFWFHSDGSIRILQPDDDVPTTIYYAAN